mgnify:FL=1
MMSLCHFRMEGNDEAARVGSGSDTDGCSDKAVRLPLTVVGLHVNLFASDQSEMASDKNWFVSCSALCVRALVKLNIDGNVYHNLMMF